MENNSSLDVVVLAAGASTRFNGNKLNHTLPAVLNNILDAFDQNQRVICISSSGNQSLVQSIIDLNHKAANAHVVINEGAEHGMGSSIAIGSGQCSADHCMIFLGDMPLIKPDTLRLLVHCMAPGAIIAPTYQGQRGHPVIFSAKYYQDLRELAGDNGARYIIENYHDSVQLIDVDDKGVIIDIDTRDDLEEYQSLVRI